MNNLHTKSDDPFEFELKMDDNEFSVGMDNDGNYSNIVSNEPPINLFDIDMKYQSVDLTSEGADVKDNVESDHTENADQGHLQDVNSHMPNIAIAYSLDKKVEECNKSIEQQNKSDDIKKGTLTQDIEVDSELEKQRAESINRVEQLQMDISNSTGDEMNHKMSEPIKDEIDEENAISLDDILVKSKQACQEEDADEFDFEFTTPDTTKTIEKPAPKVPQQPFQNSSAVQNDLHTSKSNTEVQPPVASSMSNVPPTVILEDNKSSGSWYTVTQETGDQDKKMYALPVETNTKAHSEWDNVQTIEASFADENDASKGGSSATFSSPLLSYYELQEHFSSHDFSNVKNNIHTTVNRRGFSALKHFLFGPPKLCRNLMDEKNRVFCIAASSLENSNPIHTRCLQTIYRCLTGSRFDCSRYGNHWEEIGFQGNDPSTDLRAVGLLGLMNLVYMLRDPKRKSLALDIYKLSLHPTQNFPFCVMGINMSRITLQALREDCLNRECNRRGDVSSVVNDYYTGIYLHMYQIWKSQGKTIKDSGFVLKDVEANAKKNPKAVFSRLEEYLDQKKSSVNLESMDVGGDNFLNVVDTDAGQY